MWPFSSFIGTRHLRQVTLFPLATTYPPHKPAEAVDWGDVIDPRLVERINSERCFALVGSGPSSELRYPSWKDLANLLLSDVAATNPDYDRRSYEAHIEKREYPELFSQAEDDLGGRRQPVSYTH